MMVTYNGRDYWVSYIGKNATVYAQCVNRFGNDCERMVKRGGPMWRAVMKIATEKREEK